MAAAIAAAEYLKLYSCAPDRLAPPTEDLSLNNRTALSLELNLHFGFILSFSFQPVFYLSRFVSGFYYFDYCQFRGWMFYG